jgi:hypothetical protein
VIGRVPIASRGTGGPISGARRQTGVTTFSSGFFLGVLERRRCVDRICPEGISMSTKQTLAATQKRKVYPTPKPPPVHTHSSLRYVDPGTVNLVRVSGSPKRGGAPGGEAWRIDVKGKRAGSVFVNVINQPPLGRHASIQIFLNRTNQGRRVGRLAMKGHASSANTAKFSPTFASRTSRHAERPRQLASRTLHPLDTVRRSIGVNAPRSKSSAS